MYKKRYKIDKDRVISNTFIGKKGQVTIFIILGILILLAVILVIMAQKEIITFKPEELAPSEKERMERFITNCIDKIGKEALLKIGLQGGYVETPSHIKNDAGMHLKISPMHVVPYWAYGPNTEIPSLAYIKNQIDTHLEENLRECVLGTEAFQETYDLIEKSVITANTEIVESKVIFNVHWDLEIRDKAGEVIAEVINHVAESPIKLKQVYDTAKQIIEREMQTLKFEDITQDLIALEHPQVPVAGMELSCGEKKWKVSTVKEKLMDLLRVNIRELKVEGTSFVEFPDDLPYYQNHYVWSLAEDFKKSDVSVLFTYENNYPFSFEITPRHGTYLRSNSLASENNLISSLCIQTWKFVYDVSYPVLVDVLDETTGYHFKMAFTVHLQKNIPDRSGVVMPRNTLTFDTFDSDDFCQDRRIPMTVYTYELVENEDTGVYNREPLGEVDLNYACIRYTCEIGTSEYGFAGMGDVAAYRTNFPYCVGGIMRGEKVGYKETWERVVTEAGKETELELVPIINFPLKNIKVVKHKENIQQAIDLSEEETALIHLINNKKEHDETIVLSQEMEDTAVAERYLTFLAKADFDYSLEINVLEGEEFVAGYKQDWNVPWEQLQNAQEITFHVLSQEGSEAELLEFIADLEEKSTLVPEPEIR